MYKVHGSIQWHVTGYVIAIVLTSHVIVRDLEDADRTARLRTDGSWS